eukprot:TRINITY_DN926_c0_g1_i1.p1 TRINITY_DN926_c0_g1~~TRINITY_DN926_c0_g1_i1.p1  ORF type:complete len:126 (+),score=29.51 TRINITY_DN926_c0_g1_i1:52-378(+)
MTSAIITAVAALTLGGAQLVEYSYNDNECSTGEMVAQRWNISSCIGVGNEPPYLSSEKVDVLNNDTVAFTYYQGGECAGEPFQTSNQSLNICKYMVASTYTKFSIVKN